MNKQLQDRWWIAYFVTDTFKDETSLEANSVGEGMEAAEAVFLEKYPEYEKGGYTLTLEKGMMTSNSVEPDYYGMTQ